MGLRKLAGGRGVAYSLYAWLVKEKKWKLDARSWEKIAGGVRWMGGYLTDCMGSGNHRMKGGRVVSRVPSHGNRCVTAGQ